jgi:hypothetical protein
MDKNQQTGCLSETILTEWLIRKDWYVARPVGQQGPADVVAYNEDGEILLLDSKTDGSRVIKGRKSASRIYRTLTDVQKKIGVRVAYVDPETRQVTIIPPLEK